MTHAQKLKSIVNKLQSAEKDLADLIDKIPETAALKAKIDSLRKQYDQTMWTKVFESAKRTLLAK